MTNIIMMYVVLWIVYLSIAWLGYNTISNEYKKRYIVFVILSGLLLKPVVSTAVLVVFYVLRKIPIRITTIGLILICVGTMSFRIVKGYYPLPYFMRMIYYAICDDINEIDPISIDEEFLFWKQGYTIEKEISSPYSLNHSLVLSARELGKLPNDMPECHIQVSIYRKQKLIFRKETELLKDISQQDQVQGIRYVSLAYIPFPLDKKSYKNITIKVEVVESDENLKKHFEGSRLYLFPDISLN